MRCLSEDLGVRYDKAADPDGVSLAVNDGDFVASSGQWRRTIDPAARDLGFGALRGADEARRRRRQSFRRRSTVRRGAHRRPAGARNRRRDWSLPGAQAAVSRVDRAGNLTRRFSIEKQSLKTSGGLDQSLTLFQGLPSAGIKSPGRCPAASSRCSRSRAPYVRGEAPRHRRLRWVSRAHPEELFAAIRRIHGGELRTAGGAGGGQVFRWPTELRPFAGPHIAQAARAH